MEDLPLDGLLDAYFTVEEGSHVEADGRCPIDSATFVDYSDLRRFDYVVMNYGNVAKTAWVRNKKTGDNIFFSRVYNTVTGEIAYQGSEDAVIFSSEASMTAFFEDEITVNGEAVKCGRKDVKSAMASMFASASWSGTNATVVDDPEMVKSAIDEMDRVIEKYGHCKW